MKTIGRLRCAFVLGAEGEGGRERGRERERERESEREIPLAIVSMHER